MEIKNTIISVVVSMYFEELVAQECYDQLKKTLEGNKFDYELIFINDVSTDKTEDILLGLSKNDKRVKMINFSTNFGHQTAVTAGIFASKGDAMPL